MFHRGHVMPLRFLVTKESWIPNYHGHLQLFLFPGIHQFVCWDFHLLASMHRNCSLQDVSRSLHGASPLYTRVNRKPEALIAAPTVLRRHTEDLDLFSCNFMHFSAPKTWYAVSEAQRSAYECEVQRILGLQSPGKYKAGSGQRLVIPDASVAYHRLHFVEPSQLEAAGIRVTRYIQKPGDLVLTMPGAYHAGFSHVSADLLLCSFIYWVL